MPFLDSVISPGTDVGFLTKLCYSDVRLFPQLLQLLAQMQDIYLTEQCVARLERIVKSAGGDLRHRFRQLQQQSRQHLPEVIGNSGAK